MTNEMKKYTKIRRYGHSTTKDVLTEGDSIVIQEKLDGANASFKREGDTIRAFSRKTELDENNTLRGFYEWTQTLDVNKLTEGVIYFGEWLVRHKIDYGKENEKQFYLFDIYSEDREKYEGFGSVIREAIMLDLNIIPIFYIGKYQSFEHLEKFIGMSRFTGKGEGIVVKNYDYVDRFGNQLFVKLVTPEFAEMQQQKKPKEPKGKSEELVFVEECLTSARVEKMLHKLVDEGIIEQDFGLEDMGVILQSLKGRVYDDIIEEEGDNLPSDWSPNNVRKAIGKTLPHYVKSVINGGS